MSGYLFFLSLGMLIGFLMAAFLMRDRRRGSGITPDMHEMLVMPHYERIARGYARTNGYPESEWHRFQHRAIAEIIYKARS